MTETILIRSCCSPLSVLDKSLHLPAETNKKFGMVQKSMKRWDLDPWWEGLKGAINTKFYKSHTTMNNLEKTSVPTNMVPPPLGDRPLRFGRGTGD